MKRYIKYLIIIIITSFFIDDSSKSIFSISENSAQETTIEFVAKNNYITTFSPALHCSRQVSPIRIPVFQTSSQKGYNSHRYNFAFTKTKKILNIGIFNSYIKNPLKTDYSFIKTHRLISFGKLII